MKTALVMIVFAAVAHADDSLLQWMDRIAQQQLAARESAVAKIATPAQADARRAFVRAKILELLGGLPDYQGPLNARTTSRVEQPGYVIENVIFESLPKLYVTANLYRPAAPGRYPGILFSLGHWEEGKPAAQRISANLALKGFVVLAYDPSGQGERQQAYDSRMRISLAGGSTTQHILAGGQSIMAGETFARFRIWDAKRALDYLVSRPEVDVDKIGCTGCSGGGTIATYISALDPRIKVAAPACYINTWRLLFSGPTGDSEQSLPFFLSSGLDIADYIELFAPKPWLISSTVGDFFPLEGARQAYSEARRWYGIYGAPEKIQWAIGPGGHGTPLEIREAIYEWMIRWLKDGKGEAKEQSIEMLPDFKLWATPNGQVDGREVWEAIRDDWQARQSPRSVGELVTELRKWSGPARTPAPARVLSEKIEPQLRVREIAMEVEPGLEITGTLYLPRGTGRHPATLLVGAPAESARCLAGKGQVALAWKARGTDSAKGRDYIGDWLANTRALLIGRDLAGLRAGDIVSGVAALAGMDEIDAQQIRGVARGVAGAWMLMAAALDPRISAVALDRTPYKLSAAFDGPIQRDLHDVAIPGFALHWDMQDLVKAAAPRQVLWIDPADWNGRVLPNVPNAIYRVFDGPDPLCR